jgi:hypothetical protein
MATVLERVGLRSIRLIHGRGAMGRRACKEEALRRLIEGRSAMGWGAEDAKEKL